VQGTAEALPFGRDALDALLDLAQKGIGDLIGLQKHAVGHILK
jgi:ribonuclease PH